MVFDGGVRKQAQGGGVFEEEGREVRKAGRERTTRNDWSIHLWLRFFGHLRSKSPESEHLTSSDALRMTSVPIWVERGNCERISGGHSEAGGSRARGR